LEVFVINLSAFKTTATTITSKLYSVAIQKNQAYVSMICYISMACSQMTNFSQYVRDVLSCND